jgi:hypothetical protein
LCLSKDQSAVYVPKKIQNQKHNLMIEERNIKKQLSSYNKWTESNDLVTPEETSLDLM